MNVLIGLDDTDNLSSRGTGNLARQIASQLAGSDWTLAGFSLLGVTRHQLLVDPRVPCTKNNSSAAIALSASPGADLDALFAAVRDWMLADFQPGSEPGLCLAVDPGHLLADFGCRAQCELVTAAAAYELAELSGARLVALGGDGGGVIGALAAVGLAASGEDGRYISIGQVRDLTGLLPVAEVLAAGVRRVQTLDGKPVTEGFVQVEKLRPARRGGQPVAVVERSGEVWLPLKLD